MLSSKEVLNQSKRAFNQWEKLWKRNTNQNKKVYKKNKDRLTDIAFTGTGKTVLCCGFGYSFERDIDIINEMSENGNFDIIAIDKAFSYLKKPPKYCIIADASVSIKWLRGANTSKTTLIANICANPEWINAWKGPILFYVNKDNIESEKIFSPLSECYEQIPAASNVGNAAVVVANDVLNYDKILLSGYDFAWIDSYYAFYETLNKEAKDKKAYMNHRLTISSGGEIVNTSENLLFSAKWLNDYYKVSKADIRNTTYDSISSIPVFNLKRQLEAISNRKMSENERNIIIGKMVKTKFFKRLSDAVNLKNIVAVKTEILEEPNQWILES